MKKFTFLLSVTLLAANLFAADKYVTVAQGDATVEGSFPNVIPTLVNGDVLRFNIPGTDEVITTSQVTTLPVADGNIFVIEGINEATGNRITMKSAGGAYGFFRTFTTALCINMSLTFRNLNIKGYKNTTSGGAISVGSSAVGPLASATHPKLLLENCDISDCKATCNTANNGGGGAIYNGRGVFMVLKNCAIYKDTLALQTDASSRGMGGAGIGSTSSDGNFVFINSTFYGNVCTGAGKGGAIFNCYQTISINCTFTNNYAFTGGGWYVNSGVNDIANCIFAQNLTPEATAATADFHYVNTTVASRIYNSIGGNVSSNGAFVLGLDWTANSNKLFVAGTDVLFECDGSGIPILKDNGGKTQTVALASSSSIAANAGISSLPVDFVSTTYPIPTTDQRGATRSASTPSVGAYEYGGILTSLTPALVKAPEVSVLAQNMVLNTNADGTCFIYNGTGKLVHQESIHGASVLNKSFIPGFYIVKFVSQDKASSGVVKVVIQ